MKLEESYAQALHKSVKGKTADEGEKILKRFFSVVLKKGHGSLLPRVGKAFERIESREVKKNTVMVFVKEGGKETIPKETVLMFSAKGGGGENPIYEACEDNTIIGGYVAKGKGLQVDASYKTSLLSLYSKIKS